MSYRAARQVEPDVPRVQSDDGYQRINGDGYRLLDNGRIDRLRNCLIVQGIIIAVVIIAVLALVLSVGVMSSIPRTLSCYQETKSCFFFRSLTSINQTNSTSCTTETLPLNVKV